MKKFIFTFSIVLLVHSFTYSQTIHDSVVVENDIFKITYSEKYQQPLRVSYTVQCPMGDADRGGMDFFKESGIVTSDNDDYKNNVWDKGHMAPAADFNCNKTMLKMTFSYLNCALQHQGLNRGPWKELERFERDLAKVYAFVNVTIVVKFEDIPKQWLPTGALIPIGFTKIIWCDGEKFEFYFPNEDVAGRDWIEFKIR